MSVDILQIVWTKFTYCLHVFCRVCQQGLLIVCRYFAECVDKVYLLFVCILQSVSKGLLIVCIFRLCRQGLLLNNCLYVFCLVYRQDLLIVCMYIAECVDKVYLLSVCVLPSVPTRFTHCM